MIDLADIQGDILRAYGNRYRWTTYLFVAVHDAAAGRAWLGARPRHERRAVGRRTAPEATLNVALSAAGPARARSCRRTRSRVLERVPRAACSRAPRRSATRARARPERWDDGLRGAARRAAVRSTRAAQARARRGRRGRAGGARRPASRWCTARTRSCSATPSAPCASTSASPTASPSRRSRASPTQVRTNGGGVPLPGGGWRPLAPGEFVLGYPDEDTRTDPEAPAAARAGRALRPQRHLHGAGASCTRTSRCSGARSQAAAAHYPDGDADALAAKVVGPRAGRAPARPAPARHA